MFTRDTLRIKKMISSYNPDGKPRDTDAVKDVDLEMDKLPDGAEVLNRKDVQDIVTAEVDNPDDGIEMVPHHGHDHDEF